MMMVRPSTPLFSVAAVTWWTVTLLSTECLSQDASGTSSNSSLSSNGTSNSTVPPSPYLKHGSSYRGATASKLLSQSISTIAAAVTIDNWTRWALILPEADIPCGRFAKMDEEEFYSDVNSGGTAAANNEAEEDATEDEGPLPGLVRPGYTEMVMFEKESGLTGVCGVVTYTLELEPSSEPEHLVFMFSVPYHLNLVNSYFAVGASNFYLNVTDLFRNVYYYTGAFDRRKSGQMAEFKTDKVRIRANMDPDTYKPILSVQIQPVNKSDWFTPGEHYVPRRLRSGVDKQSAGNSKLIWTLLTLAMFRALYYK